MPRTVRLDTSAKILRFAPVPGYEALRLKELSPSHGVQKLHDEGAVELLPSSDLQLELEVSVSFGSICALIYCILMSLHWFVGGIHISFPMQPESGHRIRIWIACAQVVMMSSYISRNNDV